MMYTKQKPTKNPMIESVLNIPPIVGPVHKKNKIPKITEIIVFVTLNFQFMPTP